MNSSRPSTNYNKRNTNTISSSAEQDYTDPMTETKGHAITSEKADREEFRRRQGSKRHTPEGPRRSYSRSHPEKLRLALRPIAEIISQEGLRAT